MCLAEENLGTDAKSSVRKTLEFPKLKKAEQQFELYSTSY